jgi:hypothetical protein
MANSAESALAPLGCSQPPVLPPIRPPDGESTVWKALGAFGADSCTKAGAAFPRPSNSLARLGHIGPHRRLPVDFLPLRTTFDGRHVPKIRVDAACFQMVVFARGTTAAGD